MQNVWLFKANPAAYDLAVWIQKDKVDDWGAEQHLKTIADGDTAIIWASGGESGICGFGKIIGKPYGDNRVKIEITQRIDSPLPASALRDDPVLGGMLIFRQAFGRNPFKVTANEWEALSKFRAEAR